MKLTKKLVKIGLIQGRSFGSKQKNLDFTVKQIKTLAKKGVQVICTQELFNTDYFCDKSDNKNFNLAEEIPGPTSDVLCKLSKHYGIVLIAAYFEKCSTAVYHNSAVVIDSGNILGVYRKMHIPQDPHFEEKFYFTPGNQGFPIWDTSFGKIGVMICWDQWFSEATRIMALKGAEIIFYPTAIGWLKSEKRLYGDIQHNAWQTVQRGNGITNTCFIASTNRVGYEDNIEFWGQSFVSDYYGRIIKKAPLNKIHNLIVECDLVKLEKARKIWPFFRDRRPSKYNEILNTSI